MTDSQGSSGVASMQFDVAHSTLEKDVASVRDMVTREGGLSDWRTYSEPLTEWCDLNQTSKKADLEAWVASGLSETIRQSVASSVSEFLSSRGYVSETQVNDPQGGIVLSWVGPSGEIQLGSAENTTLTGKVPCLPVS